MKKITFTALNVPLMCVLILLLCSVKSYAQEKTLTLTGVVKDVNGPLDGVLVWQTDTENGTQTNELGFYTIKIPMNAKVTFEQLGYKPQTFTVKTTTLNVTMTADENILDEMVINAGYYTVKDKERTGSISKITAKDIGQQPVANPLAAMQGRMAGVNITQNSGVPGGGFDIQIRGRNSLRTEGNAPLYIVDGVPFLSESRSNSMLSNGILNSTENSPLQLINPNDIESIEVLKDADATAIYGSRGANGVVLISTKKGTNQPVVVTLQSYTAVGTVPRFMKLLNTTEYLKLRQEGFSNDGIVDYPANAYDINGTWGENRYTNWQKALIGGKAISQQVTVSARGGDLQNRFMVQGSTAKEGTVFPGEYGNKRKNILAQFNHSSKNKKWNLQTQFSRSENKNKLLGTDLTQLALTLAPNAPELYDEEGNLNWENGTWDNPLRWSNLNYSTKSTQWLTSWLIEGEILTGLVMRLQAGYNESNNEEKRITPNTFYNPAWGLTSAASNSMFNHGQDKNWNIEPQLNYTKSWKNHKLTALIGSSFLKQESSQMVWYASNFTSNSQLNNLAAAKSLQLIGNSRYQYAYNSVFTRINYQFADKYIVNLTGRRDGSSRFGPGKKWGNFGSIGMAWLFSNETFLNDAKWLSFGKLRGSYGTTGNDRIGDYQYLDTYGNSGGIYDVGGLYPLRLFNPDFSWETNLKKEIALELAFFDNKLNVSSAYYLNTSSNQLVGIPLPGTTGFNTIQSNLPAKVENKGFEFELKTKFISNSNWQWEMYGNISFNRNKLIAYPNLDESSYKYTYAINHPLSMKYVYEFIGIDQETGFATFKDFNNDGKITADEDMKLIMDTTPKYFLGFGNNISYKNWSLSFLFQAVKQNGRNYIYGWSMPGTLANQSEYYNQENMPLPSAGYNPDAYSNYNLFMQSQAAYSDASYIRLKNINVNYNIPMVFNSKLKASIYLSGQNVFTITSYKGLDPENQNNAVLPPLKVWSLGFILNY